MRIETVRVHNAGALIRGDDMTHRRDLLNHVEDELGFPLVTRIRGGSTGSGSVLTEEGKALMNAYDHFSEHLNSEARSLYNKIFEPIAKLN